MSAAARILDANCNRAREALRVMEDIARFALNDAATCGELKSIRHDLRAAIEHMAPPGALEANRDVTGDVGTVITTNAERQRDDLLDVAAAAGKRLSESLRVIEEVSKTFTAGDGSTDAAEDAPSAMIESLRYRAYAVESQLLRRLGSGRAAQWTVCLVLTKSLCRLPWREVVCSAIAGGVDCIQVREKDMHSRELAAHVREVIECAQPHDQNGHRPAVIVNDRVDIALAADADGVHLGQDDLSVQDVRRIAGRRLIVGISAHDMNEARAAIEHGADYCGVGTMFASSIKPGLKTTGPEFLSRFIEKFPGTPHLAIGGITPTNVHLLVQAGARGVAVSSAVCAAEDPARVVRALRTAITGETAGAVATREPDAIQT